MTQPIEIRTSRQLFLDGHVIEWCDKLRRRVCPVVKHPHNPVIRPEEDWEPRGYITYGSILYDQEESIYKAWAWGSGPPNVPGMTAEGGRAVYYFVSDDGVQWERPCLDVVPDTNIVAAPDEEPAWPGYYELFGVSKDLNENDPARRYKMGFLYYLRDYRGFEEAPFHPGQLRALGVAFSSDGTHWSPLEKHVSLATMDGTTFWFYDEGRSRYVLYGRTKHIAPEVRARHGEDLFFQRNHWGRAVKRSESEDFVTWTPNEGELILAVDALDDPGDEIYGMSVFPYEGLYIGLVQIFHNYEDAVWLDVQLAVSRDSVHFQRLSDRTPFIPVGEVGAWDRFNNSPANSVPLRVDDELRFYYGGRSYAHGGAYKGPDRGLPDPSPFRAGVGLGSVKLDRFAAMEATFEGGRLRTKPLLFEGGQLHVNATVPFGRLEVQALDLTGEPLPDAHGIVEMTEGTGIAFPLSNLHRYAGQPVLLEFAIWNGQLYSFWVD